MIFFGGTFISNRNASFSKAPKPIPQKDVKEYGVNFYDYDGTLLYSFTEEEVLATDENNNYTWQLPPLPDRTGENLVNEGWNWSIENIRSYVSSFHWYLAVGCTYHTKDGFTHIWWNVKENNTVRRLKITPTEANSVTVNWGDGSYDILQSATTTLLEHVYSEHSAINTIREFHVTIQCSSGAYSFPEMLCGGVYAVNTDNTYQNNSGVKKVFVSEKVSTLANGTFAQLAFLEKITIPATLNFGNLESLFYGCSSLKHITLPDTHTVSDYAFAKSGVETLSFGKSHSPGTTSSLYQTNIKYHTVITDSTVFGPAYLMESKISKYKLNDVTQPYGGFTVSIGQNSFKNCSSLWYIELGSKLTSIGDSAFFGCTSLVELWLPETLSTLSGNSFGNCTSLKRIYSPSITPPTIQQTTFSSLPSTCVIYVPQNSLSVYQSAQYWSNYASQMQTYNFS